MYNTITYTQNHGNISPLAVTCMVHFAVKYSDDLHQQDHKHHQQRMSFSNCLRPKWARIEHFI